jgi:monoamine oxidase
MKTLCKYIITFSIILGASFNLTAQKPNNFDYDVVVIGGGMSGLSAAYELANYKVLVIEKENRLGGRVQTIAFDSLITLDMGAAFAFESELIPFEYKLSPIIDEFYQMALITNDTVVYGTHPQHCLKNLGWPDEKMKEIQQYDSKYGIDFSQFSPKELEIINSFNSLVAAGDIRDYNPKRQLDAFKQWSVSHYTLGNQQIVNAFASKFEGDLAINAEVKSVEAIDGGGVRIVFEKEGVLRQVTALSAIVSTPPKVTNQIIINKNKVAQYVLDNIV